MNIFSKQNNNSAFWYISLLSLCNYYVKFPNFMFYGGHKHTTANFVFLNLELVLESDCRRIRLQLTNLGSWNSCDEV